eukprot:EG_transcript_2708
MVTAPLGPGDPDSTGSEELRPEEGRKHRPRDKSKKVVAAAAVAEAVLYEEESRPRQLHHTDTADTAEAAAEECDEAGNRIDGRRRQRPGATSPPPMAEPQTPLPPRRSPRKHAATDRAPMEVDSTASGPGPNRHRKRHRRGEDAESQRPCPFSPEAVGVGDPGGLFATPVRAARHPPDEPRAEGSGRKSHRQATAVTPSPPPPPPKPAKPTDESLPPFSLVTPEKAPGDPHAADGEPRRKHRKHKKEDPASPELLAEVPPEEPAPGHRSHRKTKQVGSASPPETGAVAAAVAEADPDHAVAAEGRHKSRRQRRSDPEDSEEAAANCVTPAKVSDAEWASSGPERSRSHRKRRREEPESPQLLEEAAAEGTPQCSPSPLAIPCLVVTPARETEATEATLHTSGKHGKKRQRDAEPSSPLPPNAADWTTPSRTAPVVSEAAGDADGQGSKRRYQSRGERLASLVSRGAADDSALTYHDPPPPRKPRPPTSSTATPAAAPPPVGCTPAAHTAQQPEVPAAEVFLAERSPRPLVAESLQQRVKELAPDAALVFHLFKTLSVLVVQPRNRLLSRLRPALEAAAGGAVQPHHVWQVALVAPPGWLEVSRVKVDGVLDTHVKPLQLFNRQQHLATFLDALEKADLAAVQRDASLKVTASVSQDENSLAVSSRPVPTVPMFREAQQLYAERARPVTSPAEVAALLRTPVPERLAFLSLAKQVKVRQAQRVDQAMAQTHFHDRLRRQQLACHLPRLVDMIRGTFQPKHIRTMGWGVLVTLLHDTHPQRQQLRPSDVDAMLHLLVEAAPQWCERRPMEVLQILVPGTKEKPDPEHAFCIVGDCSRNDVLSAIKEYEARI